MGGLDDISTRAISAKKGDGMIPNLWKRAVLILSLSAAVVTGGALIRVFADSPKQQPPPYRRVESITIDPQHCTLRWTVTRGELQNGAYEAKGKTESYEIEFHKAEMTHEGVTRKFSPEEAVRVHEVMQAISHYAAESVEWFENQQGPVQRAAR